VDTGLVVGIFADDGRKFKSLYAQQGIFTPDEFDSTLKEVKYLSNAVVL
jgi:cysteine synthase B